MYGMWTGVKCVPWKEIYQKDRQDSGGNNIRPQESWLQTRNALSVSIEMLQQEKKGTDDAIQGDVVAP